MKYAWKWGIAYREKTYLEVYGKKKAHDLHYMLSQSLLGLTVVPISTAGERTGERRKRTLARATRF